MGMGASWIIDGAPYRAEHDERTIAQIPTVDGKSGNTTSLLAQVSGYAILCRLYGVEPDPVGQHFATHFEPEILAQAIKSAQEGDAKVTALFHAAGYKLGHHLFSICAALPPDQITLAGPVPQVGAYEEAVCEGLSAAYARHDLVPPPVAVSSMGFLRATELFALEEFLYGSRLDLKRLLAD
jgi:predicted NBD/HSP70 family sugar kinase